MNDDDSEDEGGLLSAINHHLFMILDRLGWILAALLVIMLMSILTYCHSR